MKTKSQKREEALERQEAYKRLSPLDRIKKLDERGHRALKERGRLMQQLMPSIAGKPKQSQENQ